jgi:hypothetical protein
MGSTYEIVCTVQHHDFRPRQVVNEQLVATLHRHMNHIAPHNECDTFTTARSVKFYLVCDFDRILAGVHLTSAAGGIKVPAIKINDMSLPLKLFSIRSYNM